MKPIGYGKLIKLLKATAPISKQFENEVLRDQRLAELFSCVAKVVLPKATEPQRWALWQCFKGLKDVRVTHRHIVSCVCRAAANMHYIHEGIAPFYWDGNRTAAVMNCLGIEQDVAAKGKRRLIVHLMCLLGEPAGLMFKVSLGCNMLEYLLGKQFGVSFRKYNAAAEEIAGCVFKCIISEDTAGAYMSDFSAAQAMKDHNRKLAEMRINPRKCKTPVMPCASCTKTRAQCILACRVGGQTK